MSMGLWLLLLIVVVLIGVLAFGALRDRAIIDCPSGSGPPAVTADAPRRYCRSAMPARKSG